MVSRKTMLCTSLKRFQLKAIKTEIETEKLSKRKCCLLPLFSYSGCLRIIESSPSQPEATYSSHIAKD